MNTLKADPAQIVEVRKQYENTPLWLKLITRNYLQNSNAIEVFNELLEIEKGVNSSQPITKMGIEEKSPFAKHSLAEWWYSVNEKVFPLDPDTGEPAL